MCVVWVILTCCRNNKTIVLSVIMHFAVNNENMWFAAKQSCGVWHTVNTWFAVHSYHVVYGSLISCGLQYTVISCCLQYWPWPSCPRHCWSFFSTFCCRRRFITASGLEMLRVNLVSGISVYSCSAALPASVIFFSFSFFFCSFFSLLDSFLLNVPPWFSLSTPPPARAWASVVSPWTMKAYGVYPKYRCTSSVNHDIYYQGYLIIRGMNKFLSKLIDQILLYGIIWIHWEDNFFITQFYFILFLNRWFSTILYFKKEIIVPILSWLLGKFSCVYGVYPWNPEILTPSSLEQS